MLAQPGRGVVVINGDGCTLMNLGCLVTIAANPTELYLVIIENGLYEVTGGQPIAAAGRTHFAGMARAAGIPRIYAFDNLDAWRGGAAESLRPPGPVAIVLKVQGQARRKRRCRRGR